MSDRAQLFVIYDERAMLGSTAETTVLCTATSLREARRDVRELFPRGVIFRYDVRGKQLVNETFIEGPR